MALGESPKRTSEQISAKRVGQSAYYHRDQLDGLPRECAAEIYDAVELSGVVTWNVAKVREGRVSLLTYEDFERPFPALLESLSVELESGGVRRRSYRARPNPPILHRKELLLPAGDPRREIYAALTEQLEARGLLSETSTIGTREGWARRLREAGVRVEDHQLVEMDEDGPPAGVAIHRHLAALHRDGLSTPVQALLRYGLLDQGRSLFDYGCGRGSDIEGLQSLGIQAQGWDPYFAPDQPLVEADAVNLGFVLNVIERPAERVEAVRAAYGLARGCLAVAVITSTSARLESSRPYADGYVTARGTFQKFYTASELKGVLERALGREAFQAGPGLFFVFKDELYEQVYLAARQERRARRSLVPRLTTAARRLAKIEALRPELEALYADAIELGRWPYADELAPDVVAKLEAGAGSLGAALRLAESAFDLADLRAAAEARREDLLVYFALNLFNRRTAYRQLPVKLQRDVKAQFGDYASAQAAARDLLFSMGRPNEIAEACHRAAANGLGVLDDDGGYWLHAELLERLPIELRCFAGCADRYYGGLESSQVLKFHLSGGKLTALRYQDFETSPLPRLTERVKIDLRSQRILEFDHSTDDQHLVMKSRLMAPDQGGYERQAVFDEKAAACGLSGGAMRASAAEIQARLGAWPGGYRTTVA